MSREMSINENGDMPAYPVEGGQNNGRQPFTGLTKLEYFASVAMQGYISAGSTGMPESDDVASWAVQTAKDLLAELDS